ncbi:hypothetical protein [Sediminitomix flava]|nr:hypothetical protein [Sediminitomix flava]
MKFFKLLLIYFLFFISYANLQAQDDSEIVKDSTELKQEKILQELDSVKTLLDEIKELKSDSSSLKDAYKSEYIRFSIGTNFDFENKLKADQLYADVEGEFFITRGKSTDTTDMAKIKKIFYSAKKHPFKVNFRVFQSKTFSENDSSNAILKVGEDEGYNTFQSRKFSRDIIGLDMTFKKDFGKGFQVVFPVSVEHHSIVDELTVEYTEGVVPDGYPDSQNTKYDLNFIRAGLGLEFQKSIANRVLLRGSFDSGLALASKYRIFQDTDESSTKTYANFKVEFHETKIGLKFGFNYMQYFNFSKNENGNSLILGENLIFSERPIYSLYATKVFALQQVFNFIGLE